MNSAMSSFNKPAPTEFQNYNNCEPSQSAYFGRDQVQPMNNSLCKPGSAAPMMNSWSGASGAPQATSDTGQQHFNFRAGNQSFSNNAIVPQNLQPNLPSLSRPTKGGCHPTWMEDKECDYLHNSSAQTSGTTKTFRHKTSGFRWKAETTSEFFQIQPVICSQEQFWMQGWTADPNLLFKIKQSVPRKNRGLLVPAYACHLFQTMRWNLMPPMFLVPNPPMTSRTRRKLNWTVI